MLKNIFWACSLSLISVGGFAQTGLDELLNQVELNNLELQSLATALDGKRLEFNSENNLPDPDVAFFYLPYGVFDNGVYTEYQISQNFEFPSVYVSRKGLIKELMTQSELDYKSKRQEILLSAQIIFLDLVFLSKMLDVYIHRKELAKSVLDQLEGSAQNVIVDALELNKAKLALLHQQFSMQKVENQIQALRNQLENLNGGKTISIEFTEYPLSGNLKDAESIWLEKLNSEPYLLQLKQQELIAMNTLKLEKSKVLPNLLAGYNRQGVPGLFHHGFYGGFTIPLWGSRGKVQAAQSQVNFQSSFNSSKLQEARVEFDAQYQKYQLQLNEFEEYQRVLTGLDSENLLRQAYEQKQLSFLQYFEEVQFYGQTFELFLDMQHQLYESYTFLLKHKL